MTLMNITDLLLILSWIRQVICEIQTIFASDARKVTPAFENVTKQPLQTSFPPTFKGLIFPLISLLFSFLIFPFNILPCIYEQFSLLPH